MIVRGKVIFWGGNFRSCKTKTKLMYFGVDYSHFTKFYNDTIQLLHKMCLRPEGPVWIPILSYKHYVRTKYGT